MGRYANDTGGSDFKPAPQGTHFARCIRIIDLGTQHGEYQGESTVRNQIMVTWELPNETIEINGKPEPVVVSKFYTNSLGEKANLRKDLVSWRGREFTVEELMRFDLQAILGKPCTLSVVHEAKAGKTRAKVASVSALPKGVNLPAAANEVYAFWIDEWDGNRFASFSDGIKRIITESDEYKAAFTPPGDAQEPAVDEEVADDIPF